MLEHHKSKPITPISKNCTNRYLRLALQVFAKELYQLYPTIRSYAIILNNPRFPRQGKVSPVSWLIMKQKALVCVLCLITFAAFFPSLKASFVSLDDPEHLLQNPAVILNSFTDIRTIFTQTINQVYLPLTTLSFALEKKFFGLNPFVYHLDNLLLHIGVTVAVFFFGVRLNLSLRASFIAALLFGIHPMKVESVAWVTERKDVLYAFFYILALHAYLTYINKKTKHLYIMTLALGALSILAKAMAISLGLVLLLMDWYFKRKITWAVIFEKIPFFFYSVMIGMISYLPNSRNPIIDLGHSLLIWCWCLCFYLWKFLFPLHVSAYYRLPEPVTLNNWPYALSVGGVISIVVLICTKRFNRAQIAAFAYYFVSIFFLLRFDQGIDSSIVSDRFMYLSCLGICLLIGAYADFFARRRLIIAILIAILVFLGIKTYQQCFIWQNSLSLWNKLIDDYPKGFAAYLNRGQILLSEGKEGLAIADFSKAIALEPKFPGSYLNRGTLLAKRGQTILALDDFNRALALNPNIGEAYYNRAIIKEKNGDFKGALNDILSAKQLHIPIPDYYLKRLREESQ